MNKYFDISRFWLLLKLEFYNSKKAVLVTLDVTFGMLFFVGFLLSIVVEQSLVYYDHNENYTFALLIGGFVLSSLAFNRLGNSLKMSRYLTLPVSTLERMLVMWLLTSVGWVVFFSLFYYLYTLLVNPLGQLLFSTVQFQEFIPFEEYPVSVVKYYLIFQGVFLVGAAHFKGYVFPKTIFMLILFALLLGLFGYFLMSDILLDANPEVCLSESIGLENKSVFVFWEFIKVLFWWGFAPLCWVLAYLGLRDQEV